MPEKPRLWSVNALSRELRRNERTLAKALAGVPPDGKLAGRPGWHLATAWQALERYSANSEQLRERYGRDRPSCSEADIVAGERANEAVAELLDALHRESDIEKRRALFRRDGHCIGDLHRGIEALLISDPLRELHEPVLRQAVGQAIGTALALCQYELEKGTGSSAIGLRRP